MIAAFHRGATIGILLFLAAHWHWLDNYNVDGMQPSIPAFFQTNVYALSDTHVVAERRGVGTGVWLDQWYILTNCHVAAAYDGKPIVATSYDGEAVFRMTTVKCDTGADLALLRSDRPNPYAQVSTIRGILPDWGSQVFSAGYGLNMALSPKQGYTGLSQRYPHNYRVTMPIAPGDSGSPILNESGEIVGLITSVYAVQTYAGRVVPIASISNAIDGPSIANFIKEYINEIS